MKTKTWTKMLMSGMVVCLLIAGNAMADTTTPISTTASLDGSNPQHLLTIPGGILDRLYGLGNLERIDDSLDQVWQVVTPNSSLSVTAIAQTKYAGNNEEFGVIIDNNFIPLFNVPVNTPDHNYNFDNSWGMAGYYTGTISINVEEDFYFADKSEGALWSSLQSMNTNGEDHMVTWRITGSDSKHDNSNMIGHYVLAFEDLPLGNSDADYNDLIVQVGPTTPEPGTMVLLGAGLAGLAVLRKKFRK